MIRSQAASSVEDEMLAPVKSPLLRGKWDLQYSTEDMLVSLIDKGFPPFLPSAENIYQTLEGGLDIDSQVPGEIKVIDVFGKLFFSSGTAAANEAAWRYQACMIFLSLSHPIKFPLYLKHIV